MKNYSTKWIIQRVTAVILIPLTFWFIYQCILLSSQSYASTRSFFFSKLNVLLFLILMITMLYHAKLGCETIIEDYVKSNNLKKITKILLDIIIYFFMSITTLSLFFLGIK